MRCSICGKPLDRHATDIGFRLPDVVWALSGCERARRTRGTGDHISLDAEHHFIRGVVYVPLVGEEPLNFGWGLWAEVDRAVYLRYVQLLHVDASHEPPASGLLANTPVGYESLAQQPALLRFATPAERPSLCLLPSGHRLYREQCAGIDSERLHEIIDQQTG